MRLKFLLLVAVLATSAAAHANPLTGETVTCSLLTSAYTCNTGSHVVGAGNEFTVGPSGTGAITVNFSGSSLLLTFTSVHSYSTSSLRFTDTTEKLVSALFVSSTGLTGFDASHVTLSNGVLLVSLGGVGAHVGDTITINLASAPEPSSLALMGTGILCLAFMLRRRMASSIL